MRDLDILRSKPLSLNLGLTFNEIDDDIVIGNCFLGLFKVPKVISPSFWTAEFSVDNKVV